MGLIIVFVHHSGGRSFRKTLFQPPAFLTTALDADFDLPASREDHVGFQYRKDEMRICPLTDADARTIVSWRYDPPYDFYNIDTENPEESAASLLLPEHNYFSVLSDGGELIAFRCFGSDAQVPGGDYSRRALDLGGGLRPDLIGKGLGIQIIAAAMNYALVAYSPTVFRTTVADFNSRALKVCLRLGYQIIDSFVSPKRGICFRILTKAAIKMDLS